MVLEHPAVHVVQQPSWDLPDWAERMFRPMRYKVPYGGRGSSKSWTVARILVMMAYQPSLFHVSKKSLRILCARELQNSISESVHALLSKQIDIMGLNHCFKIEKQRIICILNGSEFIFSGIQKNVNKIKSMEGIDICWVEEAELVSNNSWEVLIPTIRQPGSEIWITFNPNEEDDPTWKRFVINRPPNCDSFEVNWIHNPWFPAELMAEKDYLYAVDAEAAEHVWGGKTNTRSNAVIFRGKYTIAGMTPVWDADFDEDNWYGPYYGADWGFSDDPCTLVKMWITPKKMGRPKLYFEKESWHQHLELDDIADTWRAEIPECASALIRGDNSRPETISHVCGKGLNVIAAEKWPGSVEDGIAFLRSFEQIVIDPSCIHTKEEFRLYKYKVDPVTGDVLKVIIDKHNHCIDGGRYGLEPMIGGGMSLYDLLG
jgi:phage terminase large subunit